MPLSRAVDRLLDNPRALITAVVLVGLGAAGYFGFVGARRASSETENSPAGSGKAEFAAVEKGRALNRSASMLGVVEEPPTYEGNRHAAAATASSSGPQFDGVREFVPGIVRTGTETSPPVGMGASRPVSELSAREALGVSAPHAVGSLPPVGSVAGVGLGLENNGGPIGVSETAGFGAAASRTFRGAGSADAATSEPGAAPAAESVPSAGASGVAPRRVAAPRRDFGETGIAAGTDARVAPGSRRQSPSRITGGGGGGGGKLADDRRDRSESRPGPRSYGVSVPEPGAGREAASGRSSRSDEDRPQAPLGSGKGRRDTDPISSHGNDGFSGYDQVPEEGSRSGVAPKPPKPKPVCSKKPQDCDP